MLAVPVSAAVLLAGITLVVILSWVALGAAILYFYYRQKKKEITQQT